MCVDDDDVDCIHIYICVPTCLKARLDKAVASCQRDTTKPAYNSILINVFFFLEI